MRFRLIDWATITFVSLILFLALGVQGWAAEPTPLDAPLAIDDVTLIAAVYPDPPQTADWPADQLFHYRLYLPADYDDHDRQYPIMFIASPIGNATMHTLGPKLLQDRWIVVLLVESRNRSNLWLPNFIAAHDDAMARVRAHPDMKFCTGLSGAARVCSVYPGIRDGFRGIILQAHGLWSPRIFEDGANQELAVFGTFGHLDMNLRYARQIRRAVPPTAPSLVEVWEGGHNWAPGPVLNRALDWVMRKALPLGPDPDMNDVHHWHFANLIAAYDRADTPIESDLIGRRLRAAYAHWPIAEDSDLNAGMSRIDAAMAAYEADPGYAAERAAAEAYAALLDEERASRGRDLFEMRDRYDALAAQHDGTVFAHKARYRAQTLAWETGQWQPTRKPRNQKRGWN